MAGSSFTFRCGECNRLLGVSRARIGSTVTCPKCGTELVVPDPDGGEPNRPEGGSDTASREPTAGSATAIPGLAIETEPFSLRPREPQRPYRVPDRRPPPSSEGPGGGGSGSGFVGIQVEAPPLRETAGLAGAPETRFGARPGDVIMPRTAFLLWSFVMLVALVIALAAGLLAGRFLWPGPAGAPPAAGPIPPPAAKAGPGA
jgi:ribosomal protein S27E